MAVSGDQTGPSWQVLGITTNGLVFTGLIGLSIWAFFLVFFLLLWFKILPDYFASKGEKPDWLQVDALLHLLAPAMKFAVDTPQITQHAGLGHKWQCE